MSSGEQTGWILHSGGRRFGPLDEAELRNYFRAGMVKSVDRITAPGSAKMRAAAEVALELGETVPEGPPPPELAAAPAAPAAAPMATPAAPRAPLDPAAEAERQERAARAIAAMKVDLAVLGAQPKERKGVGWLVPVVLFGSLIIAMLLGLNILKKMSSQAGRANVAGRDGMVIVEPTTSDPRYPVESAEARPAPAPNAMPPSSNEVEGQQRLVQADEYVRAGNWNGLAALAKQWTQSQPDNKEAWQYLGSAYARLKDFNASADALTKALALDPSNTTTRSLLADVYLQGGRHTEAVGLYKQIVASTPDDARIWNNYGSALMGAGETAQAIAALETAVRLDPNFKLAWNSLGNAYRTLGDESRASAAFANAR